MSLWNDFMRNARAATANGNTPRGRNPNQKALDAVNAHVANSNPFDDVTRLLEGKATSRPARGTVAPDICETVLPGSTLPDETVPAVCVTESPNSWGNGLNQASDPLVTLIGTTYQTFLQFGRQRRRFIIQNVGITSLFVIFGNAQTFGADTSSKYHLKVAAGDTYIDDAYIGRIDIASSAAGGGVSVVEFTRTVNVSQ